jgi:hypothetical protein
MEWRRGEFLVTCDPAKADVEVIAAFLRESYWAKNIPIAVARKSIENSLTFNLLKGEEQIGFARVITDFATIGYLGDCLCVVGLPRPRPGQLADGVRILAP